jgi:4'-phosphopantetheinyl transferase
LTSLCSATQIDQLPRSRRRTSHERPPAGRFPILRPDPVWIQSGCIYLFKTRLDPPPLPAADLGALLSPAERERASHFHFERDRRRAVVTWGLVRLVLADMTRQDPAALDFTRSEFGKPSLPGGPSFNLAHSGEWLLLAVAAEGRLGVDVEVVRPVRDMEQLAERNFTSDEAEALARVAAGERARAFFRMWTLKEAFLKALGGGLSIPLDSFAVDPQRGLRHALLRVDDPRESTDGWFLATIPCVPETEAAVAWDRPELRMEWLASPVASG